MNSQTTSSRWRQYAKERSPIGALLFIGFSQTLASQGALRAGWSVPRIAVGTVGIAAFMVLMRLMDEKKDFKKDQIANPTRPLPRGLISVEEISRAVRIVTGFLIILASCLYFFGYVQASGFFALCIGFALLMYKEFWMSETLQRRVYLNAILHQPVVLLMYGFTNCLFPENAPFSLPGIGMALGGLASSLTFEFCRKLNPDSDPILGTYLKVTGRTPTFIAIALSLAIYVYAGFLLERAAYFLGFAVFQAILSAIVIYFKPSKFKAAEGGSVLLGLAQMYAPWIIR